MLVFEFKAKGNKTQYRAIDEAIRTAQFIRNKCLRHWMDNRGVGKYDLSAQCAVLAKEFVFAAELNSPARQAAAERAWAAISRFFDNCKKKVPGKKGFPKFKKHSRSVEYKTCGCKLLDSKHIKFTDKKGIGKLKLVGTWDLAYYSKEQIKRVRLVKRADGYYVQFCIKVHVQIESKPTGNTVGLDLGLKYFLADSNGEVWKSPKFYRKAEHQLNRANRKKSKKFRTHPRSPPPRRGVGGWVQSNNYHKARERYARKHLRVSRQRKEYVKRAAYCVIQSNGLGSL